jgi:lamin tail-like protein
MRGRLWLLFLVIAANASAFTPGNVVVVRIVSTTGAAPVYLDEYTPSGVLVQSLAMPTAVNGANKPLTIGSAAGGLMTRTRYKEYLLLAGYAATPGTTVLGTSSVTINRVIGRVAPDNVIDTSMALTDFADGGEPRSVAAIWGDGTDDRSIWMVGTTSNLLGGLRNADLGTTSSIDLGGDAIEWRGLQVYGDFPVGGTWLYPALYGTSNTPGGPGNLRRYVKTEPAYNCCVTITTAIPLAGTSPWQIFYADLSPDVPGPDTVYVADGIAGLAKYCYNGTSWVSMDHYSLPAIGLAADVNGSVVTLYVTTGDGLYKLVDEYGYNAFLTANYPGPALIATPAAGSFFSGAAMAPDPPHVVSITRAAATPANTANVAFNVTFSESVSGVDSSDFFVTKTGAITGASVSNVSGSGSSYVVTVATGSGDGTLRLDVVDDDSIHNTATITLGGTRLVNGDFNSGEIYTIDKTAPAVVSINRAGASPTALAGVDFTVTFSEVVTGVDAGDFALAGTLTGASIANVTGSGTTRTITVTTGLNNGTLQLNLVNNNSIIDNATNALAAGFNGQAYTIDHTVPLVSSITAMDPNPSTTNGVRFSVTFSMAVNGVDASDFVFTSTGLTSPSITNIATANNIVYTVTTTSTGSGTLRLDVLDNDSITAVSNGAPLGGIGAGNGAFTFGTVYTIDVVAPSVTSIGRSNSNPNSGPTVAFNVTFSENVTGVGAGDFAIVTSGIIGASITDISASNNSAIVTVYVGAGVGTLHLNLNDDGSITDLAGNHLQGSFTTGETYNIDTIPAPLMVISQIYGGGAGQNAPYGNDFVELFNRDTIPVSLNGWTIQFASAAGSSWQTTALPNVTLAPGQYFLIQEGGATLSPFLPTADVAGTINLSASSGKVALVDNATPLVVSDPHGTWGVIDFVGYGSANASETSAAPAPSTTTAGIRVPVCNDTDNNSADFQAAAPNPHNSSTPLAPCGTFQLPPAPSGVVATATTSTSVTVTWTASVGARVYEILRTGGGSTLSLLGAVSSSPFVDSTATASTPYLYSVRAVDAATNRSVNSAPDLASTYVFDDTPLNPGTPIRAVHLQQLRTAINAVRALAGLNATTFTDPSLTGVIVKKVHIDELRTSLSEARSTLQLPALIYAETLTAAATTIKRSHINELRDGIK